jgi:hypothetical protein
VALVFVVRGMDSLWCSCVQCEAKVKRAQQIADQASADLLVVARLLTLHDAVAVSDCLFDVCKRWQTCGSV